ncbi:MAG: fumarylacetoacetase [Bryobacteraceae bacterium]|nr:fumarylacetoacetase [Bryobacteraceae bacterium]
MPHTHHPQWERRKSWVEVPDGSDFPIQNLPFGVFWAPDRGHRAGVAIGRQILDLGELATLGYFADPPLPDPKVFHRESLNAFLALGRQWQRRARATAGRLLDENTAQLRDNAEHRRRALVDQSEAEMRLPVEIGDYVDFYSSLEHAANVGKMFRPGNPLLPNWKHLPIGYHGRCSSIVAGGADVRRPRGQINPSGDEPEFAPTRKLDFELEVGFIVGKGSSLGAPIPVEEAADHIFGLVLVNDWSARDIQQWEYQPLGPFLGKSFATSISPWIVTLDALEPFRAEGPEQDPRPLPYLRTGGKRNLDVELSVWLQPETEPHGLEVCRSNFRHIYWSMEQQLAHLTSNGANVRVGDLCASGTVSGPAPGAYGSMLEITWNGTAPVRFPAGAERAFLEDGDRVTMRGFAQRGSVRIGFGDLSARVLPPAA